MIGPASIRRRERRGAISNEWSKPTPEDRPRRFIPLQINTADFAGAVVEIEIGSEFGMIGFELIFRGRARGAVWRRAGRTAAAATAAAARLRRADRTTEMLGHVRLR